MKVAGDRYRAARTALFACYCCLAHGAAVHAQNTPNEPASLPSDQELEASGAVIGEIQIIVGDVFATDTPEENVGIFRLANRLHIDTKPDVIRRQLLFASGQLFQRRLLEESERLLRSNRYLYDAEIRPVRYSDGVVDIEVRTRDVWTFKPGVYFTRTGGENAAGIELQESNLLGYGKEVTYARRADVDRTANELRYRDPQLFGTRHRMFATYASNSDGRRRLGTVDRPFYALDARWSAIASAFDWDRTDQRYNLGVALDEFRHYQDAFDVGGGWSPGLKGRWVQRFTAGWRYQRDRFESTESPLAAAEVPEDRELSYPYLGFTLFNDAYEERRNQDQIERTEDLYTGTTLLANIGLSQENWGGDRDAWIWNTLAATGFESEQRKHTLLLNVSAAGRIEDGATRNLVGRAGARYYWRVSARQLFYAALSGAAVDSLDEDRQLLLGGDNGLRGYPLRYQDGTEQALLTLEHRVYTKYYLFRLFHVGGAVFYDMGRSWGEGNAPTLTGVDTNLGLLRGAGIGLRLGSSRSAFGNVIHIDLAFPFDGDPSIDRMQFIVETKGSF